MVKFLIFIILSSIYLEKGHSSSLRLLQTSAMNICEKNPAYCPDTQNKICTILSETEYECECKKGFTYDGTTDLKSNQGVCRAENICEKNPTYCPDSQNKMCIVSSETEYECECKEGFTHDDSTDLKNNQGECKEKTNPTFRKVLTDFKPIEGETIQLTVQYEGIPKPQSIWKKDGNIVNEDGVHISLIKNENDYVETLKINSITSNDSGKYSCSITNEKGTEITASEVAVIEKTNPIFRKELTDFKPIEGETIQLIVEYEGIPKPQSIWKKDGKIVNKDDVHILITKNENDYAETLKINSVTPNDSGNYSCSITNEKGTTVTVSEVAVIALFQCRRNEDCLNHGLCKRVGSRHICECKTHFKGDRCNINKVCEDLEQTCKEVGAECISVAWLEKGFCACPTNQTFNKISKICEDICNTDSCIHGDCIITSFGKECRCEPGFEGVRCEKIVTPKGANELSVFFGISCFITVCLFIITIILVIIIIRLKNKEN